MPDPSLLVTVPTVDEPSMAPPGRHVLYVLEPVPNLDGAVDWARRAASGPATTSLAALDRFGYPTDIEVEELVDPRDWEAQGLERGTPFSLSHRFLQTGPFRPANVERRAPGLVFAGSADRARASACRWCSCRACWPPNGSPPRPGGAR